jgi:hypothetical protein
MNLNFEYQRQIRTTTRVVVTTVLQVRSQATNSSGFDGVNFALSKFWRGISQPFDVTTGKEQLHTTRSNTLIRRTIFSETAMLCFEVSKCITKFWQ